MAMKIVNYSKAAERAFIEEQMKTYKGNITICPAARAQGYYSRQLDMRKLPKESEGSTVKVV